MKKILSTTVALAVMAIVISSAQAINISSASVQSGVAVVSGGKAASNANISWEGGNVAKANKNGGFSFSGAVPVDCVGTLSDGVSTIDVALTNCTPTPEGGGVLKTGQTLCDDGTFTLGACPGNPAGQDGELQKGTARSYTSNADGTITDNSTGLVWEKLTTDATIHNVNDFYTWANAFLVKIAALNTVPCFANHCDWRLPNVNELQTLADYGRLGPAIDPVFNNGVDSFTQSSDYSSSTTYQYDPSGAWFVGFFDGRVFPSYKFFDFFVRAVRGGS